MSKSVAISIIASLAISSCSNVDAVINPFDRAGLYKGMTQTEFLKRTQATAGAGSGSISYYNEEFYIGTHQLDSYWDCGPKPPVLVSWKVMS